MLLSTDVPNVAGRAMGKDKTRNEEGTGYTLLVTGRLPLLDLALVGYGCGTLLPGVGTKPEITNEQPGEYIGKSSHMRSLGLASASSLLPTPLLLCPEALSWMVALWTLQSNT